MPWWVALFLAASGILCGVPFLHARKLAREDGKPSDMPIWFAGSANLFLVPRILREHSRRGDRWAGRALLMFCVGSAIPPVLILGLGIHDFWSR
jgi:hypothetical protein